MKKRDKHLLLLILVIIGVFFLNLDAIYINIMEARNFITAREMVQEGHWIFTTMNDMPRYEKPPLPTWLTALSAMLFGLESTVALRLPAALMAGLIVLLTYKFCVRLAQNRTYAFVAALVAATSFHVVFSGRDGQWDIFTHAFMLVTIYFLYLLFTKKPRSLSYALIAGLAFGASFLSKGPVSLYALLLPFLIAFGWVYSFRGNKIKKGPLVLFLLTAIVSSAWWNLYVYLYDSTAVSEITAKETGRWLNYNVRPFYYYWSFVVQSGMWTIPAFVALLYPYLKNKVFDKKAYRFTVLWTLAAVVLLSIIPEKKSRYLLPVLFPLAMNTAFYVEYLFRTFQKSMPTKERLVIYFHFGLIACIGLAFPIASYFFIGNELLEMTPWYAATSVALVAIGIAMFVYLAKRKIRPVFYLSIAFIIAVIAFALPMAKTINPNPNFNSITAADKHMEAYNVPLFELYGFAPEIIWEYGKPIPVLKEGESYRKPTEDRFLLLIEDKHLNIAKKELKNYSITLLETIDMNYTVPKGKKPKSRLVRGLYLVQKL